MREFDTDSRTTIDWKALEDAHLRLRQKRMPEWSASAMVGVALKDAADIAATRAQQRGEPYGDVSTVLHALSEVIVAVAWGHLPPLRERRAARPFVEELLGTLQAFLDHTPVVVADVLEQLHSVRDSLSATEGFAARVRPQVLEFAKHQARLYRQQNMADDAERVERVLAEIEGTQT